MDGNWHKSFVLICNCRFPYFLLLTGMFFLNSLAVYCQEDRELYIPQMDSLKQRLISPERPGDVDGQVAIMLQIADLYIKNNQHGQAHPWLRDAGKLAEELNDPEKLARVYSLLGIVYSLQGYTDDALINFLKSLNLSEQTDNKIGVCQTLLEIGIIHFQDQNLTQAFNYLYRASRIASELENSFLTAKSLTWLGRIYFLQDDYNQAKKHFSESLALSRNFGLQAEAAENKLWLGQIAIKRGQFSEGIEYLNRAAQTSLENQFTPQFCKANSLLGKLFLEQGNLMAALNYYTRSYNHASLHTLTEELMEAALGLSECYERSENPTLALNFLKEGFMLRNSLFEKNRTRQIREIEARFNEEDRQRELLIKENEILLLEREKKLNRIFRIFLTSIFLFSFLTALFIYNRQKKIIKKEKELVQKSQQVSEAQKALLESELRNSELEKGLLLENLDYKKKDLTNFAIHIIQKNELISEIEKDLKTLSGKDKMEVQARVRDLLSKINQNLEKSKDVDQFQEGAEQVSQEFLSRLSQQFPALTEHDKQLATQLRLNLSSKEIASLNYVSVKAVEMSRYRLRKKMNLGNDVNLVDFLRDF